MMIFYNFISFVLFNFFIFTVADIEIDGVSNTLEKTDSPVIFSDADIYFLIDKLISDQNGKVDVKLYYESLCPDCIIFDKTQFSPVVEKLSQYLNIHTYPYGNAKTFERNGQIVFKCQHGPAECYGNKLHACAIDNLQNITEAVMFNACMMNSSDDPGSNDRAADRCALSMSLDSTPIKNCAKGKRGTQLLKYYGEESKKAKFSYVPYILVNGNVKRGVDFMRDVCAEFPVPPPPCVEFFLNFL